MDFWFVALGPDGKLCNFGWQLYLLSLVMCFCLPCCFLFVILLLVGCSTIGKVYELVYAYGLWNLSLWMGSGFAFSVYDDYYFLFDNSSSYLLHPYSSGGV